MELRLLTGETERKIFADRVAQIRARHGNGFKERPRSRLAEIHLSFGNLYALFENDGDPAERMIAGLMIHDLEMFPQTCPRPDLSHLPPRSVLEVGELWSRSMGAGTLARAGAAIMAGLLDARALLAYLGAKPFDGTAFYRGIGFVDAGEAVEYPYLETLEGEPIWAQPMILEGEGLARLTRAFKRLIIETRDDNRVVRFRNFMREKSEGVVQVTARNGFFIPAPAVVENRVAVESVAQL
jgi:hypothetical protein